MRFLLGSLSLVASLFIATGVQAIPLEDLFGGEELIVGDKSFSDWDPLWDGGSVGPDFSQIDVTADNSDPDNPGLVYTATSDALSVTFDDWIDLEFSFNVSVVGSDMLINGSSLEITDHELVGSAALISIIEFVDDTVGNPLGDKFVTADLLIRLLLSDAISFSPQSAVNITTFLSIQTFDESDQTTLTQFTQHFSQVPAVPVPPTLLLLGFGLLGLWLRVFRATTRSLDRAAGHLHRLHPASRGVTNGDG